MKITAKHIEFAIAKHIGFRENNIIPNISWGLFNHECDMLVIRKSCWAEEIEIKISLSDIKADIKKKHQHSDYRIRELWFAIPENLLEKGKEFIPEKAGIYTISDDLHVKCIRVAKKNKDARKLFDNEIKTALRLGNMRTWSIRKKQLEQNGVIKKANRITKHDMRIKDAEIELNNVWFFLKRGKYKDLDSIQEQMDSIESCIQRLK